MKASKNILVRCSELVRLLIGLATYNTPDFFLILIYHENKRNEFKK